MQKNISQRELGLRFNVIKQTVSSWETGNSKPPHDTLEAMADFFGVTVNELYGRTDPKSFIEEEWPDLVQVLQTSGKRTTPEERRKIAAIIRASLEG
jgi:transcriptional regulator with XRE-family HTH domain